LLREAIHLYNVFTFHSTTPSNRVRPYIEESFFSCEKEVDIPMFSTLGVVSSRTVRVTSREMSFLKRTPLVPDLVLHEAKGFVDRLREAEILKEITWQDVKAELNSRTLRDSEARELLKWMLDEKLPADQRKQLLSTAVVIVGDEKSGKVVNLGDITRFVVPGKMPVEGDFPAYVLPAELTRRFLAKDLESLYSRTEILLTQLVPGPNSVSTNGFTIYALPPLHLPPQISKNRPPSPARSFPLRPKTGILLSRTNVQL
jgi:hypothetical protein